MPKRCGKLLDYTYPHGRTTVGVFFSTRVNATSSALPNAGRPVWIEKQMVVPSHLLTINDLSFDKQGHERILFP